jgi:hypothetical protein
MNRDHILRSVREIEGMFTDHDAAISSGVPATFSWKAWRAGKDCGVNERKHLWDRQCVEFTIQMCLEHIVNI